MSDRELLKLAAKAAAIEHGADRLECGLSLTLSSGQHRSLPRWNPLEDDGDALRLAVRLDISVNCNTARGTSWTNNQRSNLTAEVLHDDAVNFDPLAATRRAIVLAAADLAKDAEAR